MDYIANFMENTTVKYSFKIGQHLSKLSANV